MISFSAARAAFPFPANLAEAIALATSRLENWYSNVTGFEALLLAVYGANTQRSAALRQFLTAGELSLELRLLEGSAMGGALGGYTSAGTT
ncbi:MAG: hypothetical protein ACKO1V_11540, partial [Cyanobium sp.]